MPRAIWKGSISFGLVTIPIGLYAAEQPDELHFKQLDRRDLSPIGYQRVSKSTGEPVDFQEIVRGYEVDKDQYVIVEDEDLRAANVEATQTVDIVGFVERDTVDAVYFEKPYYLAPTGKRGAKPYALLREILRRTNRIGIARVVIRTRQHLAALIVRGRVLVLQILRYAHELRAPDDLEVPGDDLAALGIAPRELEMAERLVESMATEWRPEEYRDEYRDDLLALIEHKAATGRVEAIAPPAEEEGARPGEVVDLMTLLKRSVERSATRKPAKAEKPRRGRKSA